MEANCRVVFKVLFALLLAVLLFSGCTCAQSSSGGPDSSLTPPQLVLRVLFSSESPLRPPGISFADTAIAVRYALVVTVILYDGLAPCHPTALTFFGVRDTLPDQICSNANQIGLINLYTILRAFELEYPKQTKQYAAFLRANAIDPDDRSTDKKTAIGYGNVAGTRISKWLAQDGWNSIGDLTRKNFRQPFEDYSGYRPVNSPTKIRFPLRWQPLTENQGNGRFTSQVHVVPFLGGVRPLVLTRREVWLKRASKPYRNINSRSLSGQDARTLDRLIRDLFKTSANLTPKQRFLARLWENKFLSLGNFAANFAFKLFGPSDNFSVFRFAVGEMLAQYDAVIVAWKEKRRFDVLRPKTAIRLRYRGRKVSAFVNKEVGVKRIAADEWEPLIPTQAHSEYPSASALICSASFEHADFLTAEIVKKRNLTAIPPITIEVNVTRFPSFGGEGISSVTFDSFADASRSCGASRLWAGVHFGPSVPAGHSLGKGIGKLAYEFVRDLVNGKVPDRCAHCITRT